MDDCDDPVLQLRAVQTVDRRGSFVCAEDAQLQRAVRSCEGSVRPVDELADLDEERSFRPIGRHGVRGTDERQHRTQTRDDAARRTPRCWIMTMRHA